MLEVDVKQVIEQVILTRLNEGQTIAATFELAEKAGWVHQDVVGVMMSLSALSMIEYVPSSMEIIKVTEEGLKVAHDGSPEVQTLAAVPEEGITKDALMNLVGPVGRDGFSQAMRQKLVRLENGLVRRNTETFKDDLKNLMYQVIEGTFKGSDATMKDLKKRKLIAIQTFNQFSITKGPKFALQRPVFDTDLTAEMIQNGSWRDANFKAYNYAAKGGSLAHGTLHPLMKVRAEFRSILLEMGFEEMPTNQFVESSFWNFDTLFQPQQHPARDAHDTFFVTKPARTLTIPKEYMAIVKDTHQTGGGFGSIGWRYPWSEEEAHKNLLRTHTTAISSKMLYQLAQQKPFQPKRYFSIDRVFRNETVDATHLAEFHQVEGLVADVDLTLGDLIGVIATFFNRIGITDVKFKPAYNPYTEPSMEIFGYSPELDKWMEVGNSGVFRPEMLLPMGLPPNVNVIAWGLSLERPTMIKYGVKHIRDLFGHKVDLRMCRDNPICRFD